jgi:UDPglucose 6-dehydrogenase
VFDARAVVDPEVVRSAGLRLWRVGDGSVNQRTGNG